MTTNEHHRSNEGEETGEPADERATGLPLDWGSGRGSERFVLPDGWVELLARYRRMSSEPLDEIFNTTIGKEGPTEAIREREYIDEDYRDEYANFYAKTYRALPSRSERLHFFVDSSDRRVGTDAGDPAGDRQGQGQRYLGFVTLRPIIGRPVSRTMISPPAWVTDHVACLATASATLHGYPVTVRGFPYISQDSQLGSCSHAAMWMISLYFHLRYRRPRRHISDFVASARVHQDLPPAVPSRGLTPRQISAVLHDLDMQPMIYRLDRAMPDPDSPESIACRYLNSGLPVMMLSGGGDKAGHAQVLIGYGRDERGLFFVHHDDQRGPYLVTRHLEALSTPNEEDELDDPDQADEPGGGIRRVGRALRRIVASRRTRADHRGDARTQARGRSGSGAPALGEHEWQALIVPLPGRIHLSGETAEHAGRLIFEEEIARNVDAREDGRSYNANVAELSGGLDDGRLRLRSYLIEGADYKRALRGRGLPEAVVNWHLNINTSHWLWLVELQDRSAAERGQRCVVGEVAIDATSDDAWVNALLGNLPGVLMWWPALGNDVELRPYDADPRLYLSGCVLHVPS